MDKSFGSSGSSDCSGILEGVTEAQRAAITHREGPALVLAGPGAGKTFVITRRVQYLVEQAGVYPGHILVITFTNAAAREMRERFEQQTSPETARYITFGTFHSVFFRILRYAYGYRGDQIITDIQRKSLYQEILDGLQFDVQDTGEFFQAVSTEIGLVKNNRIDLSKGYQATSCPTRIFTAFFHQYQKRMLELQLIDFDDMCVMCEELLAQREDIRKLWQDKYQYILVDEMQDTNLLQYEIIRLLAQPRNNVMMVGDDDQSIYRFRGARPEIMLNFSKDFPQGKQILLDYNFRSLPQILQPALQLIGCNQIRYEKKIQPFRRSEEAELFHGKAVTLEGFEQVAEQNAYIVREIRRLHQGNPAIPYEAMAVLFRTNTQPRLLVNQLIEARIPFQLRDMLPSIYDHWITKNIMTYIALAQQNEKGSMERSDFLRVMNRPKRYLSRNILAGKSHITFSQLKAACQDKHYVVERLNKLEYDLHMLMHTRKGEPMTPWAAIHYIRHGMDYDDYLREYAEYRGARLEDYLEVIEELEATAKNYRTWEEWQEQIQVFEQQLDQQKRQQNVRREGVALMTYHSAKGLEFDAVFLMDVNEGIIPYKRAEGQEELEEERRMFYVAVTRAKNLLYLLWVKERFGKPQICSRYMGELFSEIQALQKGAAVTHRILGDGIVTERTEDKITVRFPKQGRTVVLNLAYCMQNQLLRLRKKKY